MSKSKEISTRSSIFIVTVQYGQPGEMVAPWARDFVHIVGKWDVVFSCLFV